MKISKNICPLCGKANNCGYENGLSHSGCRRAFVQCCFGLYKLLFCELLVPNKMEFQHIYFCFQRRIYGFTYRLNYRPNSSYHFRQSGYDFFGLWNQQVV